MNSSILQTLYETYSREIFLYLYSLCQNRELAEDLMQETFVKALLSLSEQHVNMRAWLYMVAKNLLFNALKKNRRRQAAAEEIRYRKQQGLSSPEADDTLSKVLFREENRRLYRLLEQLPERYREVLTLQYFGELPLKEIAVILQISPENARVLSHRAKQMLKKLSKGGSL